MSYPKMYASPDRVVQFGQGPEPQPGELVRYVLNDTDPASIRQAIPQSNSHTTGEVLGAMVVRCWGPGMVNLMVFIDGPRPWWTTSVGYDLPTLVDGLDAAAPAYEVAQRSWHYPIDSFLDQLAKALEAGSNELTAEVLRGWRSLDHERTCRVCGCTDDNACTPPCSWVEADLCSACVDVGAPAARRGRV